MYRFELEFDGGSDTNLSVKSPIANIRVKVLSGRGDGASRHITPDCASAKELDENIDRLIGELEQIRQEGRKKFSAAVG